jgi:hypothetical protein
VLVNFCRLSQRLSSFILDSLSTASGTHIGLINKVNIMNKLSKTIYIALLIASTASGTLLANNNSSSYRFNKMAESLCDSAKTDQLNILRKSIRNARTHIRTVYPNVQCEGQTLLAVAEQNHSESVISYLKLKAKPEHAVSN